MLKRLKRIQSMIDTPLRPIKSAVHPGTVFYRCTLDQLIEALEEANSNIWMLNAIESYGFDAIDLEHNLFGSYVENDVLYICETDGVDITIGQESVNPEKAFEEYPVEYIEESGYIQDIDNKSLTKKITLYEIKQPDFNKDAEDLISLGYEFTELVDAMNEIIDINKR